MLLATELFLHPRFLLCTGSLNIILFCVLIKSLKIVSSNKIKAKDQGHRYEADRM